MKNTVKYIALLLAVILMAGVLCFGLVSCRGGEGGDNGDTPGADEGNKPEEPVGTPYTFTVVDNKNTPVAGAKVKLTVNGTSVRESTTDASGNAVIYATEETVMVAFADLVSLPEGYSAAAASVDLRGETEVKFTVNALEKVKYTARVIDQNGDAVEGAMLHLCYGVICQRPQLTDSNGEISEEFYDTGDTVTVTASFDSVPDGYTKPAVYKDIPFDAGETEIVLVVTKN